MRLCVRDRCRTSEPSSGDDIWKNDAARASSSRISSDTAGARRPLGFSFDEPRTRMPQLRKSRFALKLSASCRVR